MQVSIKWLKDYIDFSWTAQELAERLTMAGIPVERVVSPGDEIEKVVTGKILSVTPHQDSDHLLVCSLEVGQKEPVTIVTGAQNVAAGQIVPVALVGAHLPGGKKIAKGKLRGVASFGMLCSAGELGLDLEKLTEEEKNGIYILPPDTPIGEPIQKILGLDDAILEFELTANRGDCFSVWGIVREIAVLSGNKPKWPQITVQENGTPAADLVKIAIEAPDLCSRFSARVLTDVKIAPSPAWMQERLAGAGIRAINNVVDVTNFVMVELGQPMHAYDYDHIVGHSLTARRAVKGENLHTLDDSNRLAKGDELVIADGEKAAGLAGVMGGLETEVEDSTTSIVLEAAAFNGASIRRTARACGLHTEASGRFERGIDVTKTTRALDRAAQLLQEMGACSVASGIVDVYPQPQPETVVSFTVDQINRRLGTDIDAKVMEDILTQLEFKFSRKGEVCQAVVPSWRNDVRLPEDISEEIARIYGYDQIPATLPGGHIGRGGQSATQNLVDRLKDILVGLGLSEELSFSFTSDAIFDKLNVPADSPLRRAVPIMNPLTDEYPLVRTILPGSLLENAARNFARKNENFALFEIAPVFFPAKDYNAKGDAALPQEVLMLAGVMTGRRDALSWCGGKENIDFYDAKGVAETILERLAIQNYTVAAGGNFMLHPGRTAEFYKGRELIATVGEVHPQVAKAFGLKGKAYVFEMKIELLAKYSRKNFRYEAIPRYPAITRDLALTVDVNVTAAEILDVISRSGGKYFVRATLFDVYEGKQIAAGKKSLAFSLKFQSADKTLVDADADEAFAAVVQALKDKFAAELRS